MAIQLRSKITDSFWFIPLVMGAVGLLLAQSMVMMDRWIATQGIVLPLGDLGAEGGRGILIAIAGSVLGVAATSFSITTSVMATASSTYGPRLVRNFMSDARNQFVLGSFGASFLYALIVLRAIRDASDIGSVFVPSLSINLAIIFGVFNVVLLIYFIHHIADSIQISTLVSRVRDDLIRSIESLYPLEKKDKPAAVMIADTDALPDSLPVRVDSRVDGFLTWIDYDDMVLSAKEHAAIVRLLVQPGDYVYLGRPIAEIWQDEPLDETEIPWPLTHINTAQTRTPYQDIRYAVQQPVDITIRALSPGINDPYTAINAIRGLSSGLTRLSMRENADSVLLDSRHHPRVHKKTIAIEHMIASTFRTLRGNVVRSIDATLAVFELAEQVLATASRDSYKNIVIKEAQNIADAFEESNATKDDKFIIKNAVEQITLSN